MDPKFSFPLPGTIPTQAPVPVPEEKNVMSLVSQEDIFKIPDQNFAIISIVVPKDGPQFALKIRGVYERLEDANRAARQLSMTDPFFDIHVVDMWNWLPLPAPELPDGGRHYSNEEFETIMKRYFKEMKERQTKMKERIEQAKEDAEKNEHGPVQEGAVETVVEYEPTVIRGETVPVDEEKPESDEQKPGGDEAGPSTD